MKFTLIAALGAATVASSVSAGGLDRSGQSVGALFETGNYVELSFGTVRPNVTGTFAGAVSSGNVAPSYTQAGAAYKQDFGDKISVALIMDQPFGADVNYDSTQTGYPIANSNASIESTGISALLRYKISDSISVHGGARIISSSGNVSLPANRGYTLQTSNESDFGYALGAAYEIPSIALRAAVTYNSEVTVDYTTTEFGVRPGTMQVVLPRSVNLDFQTGIAKDTLLLASARWVNWTQTNISAPLAPNLVDYNNDTISYTLGVGRRFNDKLSGSVNFAFEKANGGAASNLSPTDGRQGITVGLKRQITDSVALSGGVSYSRLGDATTETINANFSGNTVLGVGAKLSVSF